jgi:transcriptional regulator with XRE-family HTH domain
MSLAKRIRDCRYAKGWGPDELALRADVSRTALYQIECGKTETPRAGTLRRIAQALDVPIDRLLAESQSRALESLVSESEPNDELGLRFDPVLARAKNRPDDIARMFNELLDSPLGEGIARLVEESHRLLPARASRQLG